MILTALGLPSRNVYFIFKMNLVSERVVSEFFLLLFGMLLKLSDCNVKLQINQICLVTHSYREGRAEVSSVILSTLKGEESFMNSQRIAYSP